MLSDNGVSSQHSMISATQRLQEIERVTAQLEEITARLQSTVRFPNGDESSRPESTKQIGDYRLQTPALSERALEAIDRDICEVECTACGHHMKIPMKKLVK